MRLRLSLSGQDLAYRFRVQGSVSFILEGWGGRVSDKHLTENSELLKSLLPGTQYLLIVDLILKILWDSTVQQ